MADRFDATTWAAVSMAAVLCGCAAQDRRPPATPAPSRPPAFDFESEWARAGEESTAGSAGSAWETTINATLERALEAADAVCGSALDDGPEEADGEYRLVLDIAADGTVRRAWSDDDSAMPECTRRQLEMARFAAPPKDGQRLGILMSSRPLSGPQIARPAPGPVSPDEALRVAVMDMGTVQGNAFVPAAEPELGVMITNAVRRCEPAPRAGEKPALPSLRGIFEIAANGDVERVLVTPEGPGREAPEVRSPLADCYRHAIGEAKLPEPPWPGFWMYVSWGG